MKKSLFLLALSLVTLGACTKKTNVIPDVPVEVKEDSTYIINGITDFTLGSLDSTWAYLQIDFREGKQEKITLSIEGLPDKVKAEFEPAAGIPGFATTLMLKAIIATPGTYPIKIIGTSSTGMKKTYEVNLVIKDNFACDSFMVRNGGSYKTYTDPAGDSVSGYSYVSYRTLSDGSMVLYMRNTYLETVSGYPVMSGNFGAPDLTNEVVLVVNCNNKTITIPEKTILAYTSMGPEQYTVSGTGVLDFDAKTVTIYYNVTNSQNTTMKYRMTGKIYL
ncbi:MAG TPA: hypothetical protein VIN07_14350 [Flavipsychrobacter sp.]